MDSERLIRVGVVDNDPLALNMLVAVVGRMRGCVVLWRAMSGVEALQLVMRGLRGRGALPDVMVTDISLGDLSGLEVCRRIRAKSGTEGIGVVGITAYSTDRFADEAKAAGMDALLGKETIATALETAIGEAFARVPASRTEPELAPVAGGDGHEAPLSSRELETLRYYAQGFTTERITAAMGVGPTTVYSYRNRALAKLGAGSIPEAIHLLTKRGAV